MQRDLLAFNGRQIFHLKKNLQYIKDKQTYMKKIVF